MNTQDFTALLEAAKKGKTKLHKLEILAVECNLIELAADIRNIEVQLYPESESVKIAKKEADKLNLVFRMVELNIPPRIAWLINKTLKKHWKRRGNFDLEDAAKLRAEMIEIFGEE